MGLFEKLTDLMDRRVQKGLERSLKRLDIDLADYSEYERDVIVETYEKIDSYERQAYQLGLMSPSFSKAEYFKYKIEFAMVLNHIDPYSIDSDLREGLALAFEEKNEDKALDILRKLDIKREDLDRFIGLL